MKTQYLYSTIFEKEEDCKNSPFVFEKCNLGPRKENYPNKKLEGSLFKKAKYNENELKEKFFIYQDQSLIQFKNSQDEYERGLLNIKYARLKKIHFKDESMNYIYGFILMAKGNSVEFYHYSEEVRDEWIETIKDSVVLIDLKDEYQISTLIGRGNFAKVHLAKKKKDNQTFALKSIEKQLIRQNKRNANSILLEIDILRIVDQENVIKLYEVYESDKYIHLVFEYLEGGELFERIKSKGLYQEKDAKEVMRNLLSALEYLHEKGIVHRDLKPENLILASKENDYMLKIADFGLASFVEENSLLYLRCGSPGYVTPELLEDQGYNCLADVFSAGVILYVMLTGRPAFSGNNIHEILLKNKRCELTFQAKYWDKISAEGKDLVQKMLQKEKGLRISSREALQHQWFKSEQMKGNCQENMIEMLNEQQIINQDDPNKQLGAEGINLLSATPVIAGRKLPGYVPESPFLSSAANGLKDSTPMVKGVQMRGNGDTSQILIGGIMMNKPKEQDNSPQNNGLNLPQIPAFKKGGPGQGGKQNEIRKNLMNLQRIEFGGEKKANFVTPDKQGKAIQDSGRNDQEEEKVAQPVNHSPRFAPVIVNHKAEEEKEVQMLSDEDFIDISEDNLSETFGIMTNRSLQIPSIRPGNARNAQGYQFPKAPGPDSNSESLSVKNKPSKKRVIVKNNQVLDFKQQRIGTLAQESVEDQEEEKEMQTERQKLFDFEELVKYSAINYNPQGKI